MIFEKLQSIGKAFITPVAVLPAAGFFLRLGASDAIIGAGAFGTFAFDFLNCLLISFDLHHLINNIVYFIFGEYKNPATGEIVTGDLSRFFAGDPTAGIFMAGSFPIIMFCRPAVFLAMYKTA